MVRVKTAWGFFVAKFCDFSYLQGMTTFSSIFILELLIAKEILLLTSAWSGDAGGRIPRHHGTDST